MKQRWKNLVAWFDIQHSAVRVLLLAAAIFAGGICAVSSIFLLMWTLAKLNAIVLVLLMLFGISVVIAAMVLHERDDNRRRYSKSNDFSDSWRVRNADYAKRAKNGDL